MRKYDYLTPATLEEVFQAVAANAGKEIKLVAGGTDFMPRLNLELNTIPHR